MPPELMDGLSERERAIVEQWWASLSDEQQRDFIAVWDGPISIDPLDPAALFEIHGEFYYGEHEELEDRREWEMWHRDYYEYASDRPDQFPWLHELRVFHLGCRAHPIAKACIRRASIPADFRCPLGDRDCPMRAALDTQPGQSIRLIVRPRRLTDQRARSSKIAGR